VLDGIREGKQLTEEIEGKLVEAIKDYNEVFASEEEARQSAGASA